MATRLVIDGNSVYEIDEECECGKRGTMQENRKYAAERGNMIRGAEQKNAEKCSVTGGERREARKNEGESERM